MENVIAIRNNRVIVEINGEYYERELKTLEDQREERELKRQLQEKSVMKTEQK